MAADFFRALVWHDVRETFSAIIRLSVSSPRTLPTVIQYSGRSPLREKALRNAPGNESEMDVAEECPNADVLWTALHKDPPAVEIVIKIPICNAQNSTHERCTWSAHR